MGNMYTTEVQWGGSAAPWHNNGVFVIGGRDGQRPVGLWATSTDDGMTLTGEMQYGKSSAWPGGEGRVGFRATNIGGSAYRTEIQWGGASAPWHPNGDFVLGGRDAQRPVSLQIASTDDGETFTGTMTYGKSATWPAGEGAVGFRARRVDDSPVYRLFLAKTGDHLYTVSRDEADLRRREGWADEGVAFTLAAAAGPDRKLLYRLFSTRGAAHLLTSDPDEVRTLTAEGWIPEGTVGYVQGSSGVEIHRLDAVNQGVIIDVVVTTNAAERDKLKAAGWILRPSPGRALK